jgi:siroheme synthase
VTTAVAAPELAGIPVTHRGVASGFLVLAGQTGEALESTLEAIRPQSVTLVSMMGLMHRGELATRLIAHGWPATLARRSSAARPRPTSGRGRAAR